MGPIVVISAIKPGKLKDMPDSLLKLKGELKTAQRLSNRPVNQFLFIDRPNDSFKLYEVSEKQQEKIDKDIKSKAASAKSLQQVLLAKSDQIIKERNK